MKSILKILQFVIVLSAVQTSALRAEPGAARSDRKHGRHCAKSLSRKQKRRCKRRPGLENPNNNPTNPSVQPKTLPPVPSLRTWEGQMEQYGAKHCALLKNSYGAFDPLLAATYYDAEWVFFQIADYTRDSKWLECAQAAERIYRDQYVLPNNGLVPGYWNFSHGPSHDYLRTGDERSRKAAVQLSNNAAFASDSTPLSATAQAEQSREVAYTIMSYLNAEDMGQPRRRRLGQLVDQALDHLDQWFVRRNAPYMRPFMVGLTAHALISYDERIGDKRVLPALKNALNEMWRRCWLSGQGAFMYTDRETSSGGREPAPDLNMLIAPAYAWVYHMTGDDSFRGRADEIFAGGVSGAYLNNGKQFNQNYRWSFDYLRWRGQ